jgi:hypothetical protein
MAYTTKGFAPLRQQLRLEGGVEAVSVSGTLTLDGRSANVQAVNATAAAVVILPAEEESAGLLFWIGNVGSAGFAAAVVNDAIATITILEDGAAALLACDGTNWTAVSRSGATAGVDDRVLSGGLTLTAGDAEYQRIDPGGSARVVTLPAASGIPGATFHFSNFADAAENIDVGGIVTINQNEAVRIVSDGTNWLHQGVYSIALT